MDIIKSLMNAQYSSVNNLKVFCPYPEHHNPKYNVYDYHIGVERIEFLAKCLNI